MKDVYSSKSRDLDEYQEKFNILDGQKGMLVAINGEFIGLDMISSESTYKIMHPKLVKSYSLDAYLQKDNKKGEPSIDKAYEFIQGLLESDQSKHKSVGYGFDYRFASKSTVGSCLMYKDEIIHSAFFKINETKFKKEDIGGYRHRRSFKGQKK